MARDSIKKKIEFITISAIFCGLNIIITLCLPIKIASGQGYINLSDVLIMLLASIIHPLVGAMVGGLSSALADLILGYVLYAPFSFLIKSIEALLIGYLIRIVAKRNKKTAVIVTPLFIIIGGVFMAVSYFFTELILFDLSLASFDLGFNLIQALISSSTAIVLFYGLLYLPIYNRISITTNAYFLKK